MPPSKAAQAAAAQQQKSSVSLQEKKANIRKNGLVWAAGKYEKNFDGSSIPDRTKELPQFRLDQVKLGKVLGKGGFGTVSEVRGFHNVSTAAATETNEDFNEDYLQNQEQAKAFIAKHCLRETTGEARYALKVLSPEVVKDVQTFLQGVQDMAIEARIMGDISHPNIVRLRALSMHSPFDEEKAADYFLVMDRLYDTLEARIEKTWRPKLKKLEKGGVGLFACFSAPPSAEAEQDFYEERMVVAFDLAAAVSYLHKRKIIYRDLKPENIGFDIRNDVKLFDFGLAKELHSSEERDDGTYKLTEMTGSVRYMAPEVGLGMPYNEKCDSYSMALLIWQMMNCQEPFLEYNLRLLRERSWQGNQRRPLMNETWPEALRTLLEKSWNQDLWRRWSMNEMEAQLKQECVRIRQGDATGLEHSKRRSTHVFRGNDASTKQQMAELAMLAEEDDDEEEEIDSPSVPAQ